MPKTPVKRSVTRTTMTTITTRLPSVVALLASPLNRPPTTSMAILPRSPAVYDAVYAMLYYLSIALFILFVSGVFNEMAVFAGFLLFFIFFFRRVQLFFFRNG